MVLTAISAITKYHIVDKNTGNSIGQHPLVSTANRAFWQLRPPIPRYHGTYDINIKLRFIDDLGENETLTLKQLSKKTAFLVAFSTLSRYCLALTWATSAYLNIVLSLLFLTVLLRVSSVLVSGAGIHERSVQTAVELVSLEKVTIIYTNLWCCYYYSYNGYSRISMAEMLAVVYFCSTFNKYQIYKI